MLMKPKTTPVPDHRTLLEPLDEVLAKPAREWTSSDEAVIREHARSLGREGYPALRDTLDRYHRAACVVRMCDPGPPPAPVVDPKNTLVAIRDRARAAWAAWRAAKATAVEGRRRLEAKRNQLAVAEAAAIRGGGGVTFDAAEVAQRELESAERMQGKVEAELIRTEEVLRPALLLLGELARQIEAERVLVANLSTAGQRNHDPAGTAAQIAALERRHQALLQGERKTWPRHTSKAERAVVICDPPTSSIEGDLGHAIETIMYRRPGYTGGERLVSFEVRELELTPERYRGEGAKGRDYVFAGPGTPILPHVVALEDLE